MTEWAIKQIPNPFGRRLWKFYKTLGWFGKLVFTTIIIWLAIPGTVPITIAYLIKQGASFM